MIEKFEFYDESGENEMEKGRMENWNIGLASIRELKVRKLEVETIKKIVQQYKAHQMHLELCNCRQSNKEPKQKHKMKESKR